MAQVMTQIAAQNPLDRLRPYPGLVAAQSDSAKNDLEFEVTRAQALAASELLDLAVRGLEAGAASPDPCGRYVEAQLAALRAGASVIALRGTASTNGRASSVWTVLAAIAPHLQEWCVVFAAGPGGRKGIGSSAATASSREADDHLRDAVTFVRIISEFLGLAPSSKSRVEERLVTSTAPSARANRG